MTRFIVVPQWQGSPSTRSMTLIDGADAIAGDLPRSATVRVDVPVEAGEALGSGIRRFSSLQRTRDLITAALVEADDVAADSSGGGQSGHAVVVGGDCGVAVPAIAHAASLHPDTTVVWFDAHGDLHTPESSPSGAFGGMALRAVFDATPLSPDAAVPADRIVLAGAREFDDAETEVMRSTGLTHLGVDELADPARLADAVAATGAASVYVHVDLDVLDPAAITGVSAAVPFGLDIPTLTNAIGVLRGRLPLIGASVSGFAPPHPEAVVDDMGSVLRVVGALA
ncbi:arginase [Microbacterium sp. SGAir0570]|jgi:arginase|uniref:Arginase n=1 Tax=Microbacterium paludicola TaxID=300019 RepID=A0ABU1HZJ2_9MICO|nr:MULTISPECIES: arginase family protein [Microbacterium]APF35423.1 arginase [Microbacterium paludicola]MDR6167065.1 arginase [Microbacterium paludicola]POX66344.1 arginase [Microbacterium sp. Ru50]QCR41010.1 arginase [Microbacterium sp. SGAir0570]